MHLILLKICRTAKSAKASTLLSSWMATRYLPRSRWKMTSTTKDSFYWPAAAARQTNGANRLTREMTGWAAGKKTSCHLKAISASVSNLLPLLPSYSCQLLPLCIHQRHCPPFPLPYILLSNNSSTGVRKNAGLKFNWDTGQKCEKICRETQKC